MNQIPSTVFAGSFCMVVGVRFLTLGELHAETAALIALSLLLILNGQSLLRKYRQLTMVTRRLIAGILFALGVLLAAKSLDRTVSTQVITEQRDLLFVPH